MNTRTLGRSGLRVSALGLGCWAIGGPLEHQDHAQGWGQVNDAQSIQAIHRAIDLGINFFDTANSYGAGHSEIVLGQALKGKREQVIIATKFGNQIDEARHQLIGRWADPESIRRSCDDSLRRLQVTWIDLFQFHLGWHDLTQAAVVRDTLEELVARGKIRWYGWSTDDADRARLFAQGQHCTAIQQRINVFEGNLQTLGVCEQMQLASIIRGPLAQGLLTGKFNPDTRFPADDLRHSWNMQEGPMAVRLQKLEAVRDLLTSGERTLTQGALAYLWAKSPCIIPIPGFKTIAQVEENASAMAKGPLTPPLVNQIDTLIREPQI